MMTEYRLDYTNLEKARSYYGKLLVEYYNTHGRIDYIGIEKCKENTCRYYDKIDNSSGHIHRYTVDSSLCNIRYY